MDLLLSGLAEKVLEKKAGGIVKKATGFIKDEWEKFKIDSDISFFNYLKNSYEKYSRIKTVLYRTEPKYIYDFFEYPNLLKNNREIIKSDDVNNLLDVSNFLIIEGSGGIGKSTFLKHLFINELSKKDLIPIFIELKDLNDQDGDYEIKDYIFKKLYDLGSGFDKKYLEYALASGCFLFLFDGYDEIVSDKKNVFFKKVTAFCDRYADNYFIITSRPYSEFIEFQRFTVLKIARFSKEQAISLIQKIDYDEVVKNNFIKALDAELYMKHESFASNPLLLNIMLLTYDNYADIPEKLHLFYSNAFETLYIKHDATKGGYKREFKTKLSSDDFKRVFAFFCFVTYFNGKIEFYEDELRSFLAKVNLKGKELNIDDIIYDLTNSMCLMYKDGITYRFTHRSFQEYFTALFLKELPDSNMKKMAIELIKKDPIRARDDSVFDMLYDMCEERVEHNIIMPILEEIETDCENDKYKYYLERMNVEFKLSTSPEANDITLWLLMFEGCQLSWFVYKFVKIHNKTPQELEDAKKVSSELLTCLIEKENYKFRTRKRIVDYFDDDEIYNVFKRTWIGERIQMLANLYDELNAKKQEHDLDLSELLS